MRRQYLSHTKKLLFHTHQFTIQGDRKYQEDQLYQYEDSKTIICFGVFDGHGGKEAAVFARKNLLIHIQEQRGYLAKDPESMKRAIIDGFLSCQAAMLAEVESWPKTGSGHRSTAGTTASFVIVDLRRSRMYVAHVGDSRIVMGRVRNPQPENSTESWVATPLTIDHKPETPREKARIENDGGSITMKYNVARVVWNRKNPQGGVDRVPFLSIARSLGDLWSFNDSTGKYSVSPIPDVEVFSLTPDMRCLVLGSDGLFNMVTNEEAVAIVKDVGDFNSIPSNIEGKIRRNAAAEMVAQALSRWRGRKLRSDNISVMTVLLRIVELPRPEPKNEELSIRSVSEEDSHDNSNNSTSELRPPLNHLNQNRTNGLKRSRSLDSASSPKRQKMHIMDLRGSRDRACKRSASATAKST